MFSMARDGQLPRIFARVSAARKIPANAMLLIAGLSLVIGIVGTQAQELLTTLVTFGALTAYILLHVSVIAHFGIKMWSRKVFVHWISPIIGSSVPIYALWNANPNAKILGLAWMLLGVGLTAYFHLKGRWSAKQKAGKPEVEAGAR